MPCSSDRLADALRDAAMHLALDDHRIDDGAEIVDRGELHDSDGAGVRVDLDLADVAAGREGEVRRDRRTRFPSGRARSRPSGICGRHRRRARLRRTSSSCWWDAGELAVLEGRLSPWPELPSRARRCVLALAQRPCRAHWRSPTCRRRPSASHRCPCRTAPCRCRHARSRRYRSERPSGRPPTGRTSSRGPGHGCGCRSELPPSRSD